MVKNTALNFCRMVYSIYHSNCLTDFPTIFFYVGNKFNFCPNTTFTLHEKVKVLNLLRMRRNRWYEFCGSKKLFHVCIYCTVPSVGHSNGQQLLASGFECSCSAWIAAYHGEGVQLFCRCEKTVACGSARACFTLSNIAKPVLQGNQRCTI